MPDRDRQPDEPEPDEPESDEPESGGRGSDDQLRDETSSDRSAADLPDRLERPADDGREHDRAFDDIVSRLRMDWDDPGLVRPPAPEPEPEVPPELDSDQQPDPVDEQFYRQVPEGPGRPLERNKVAAWCGVLGTPAVLALCTLFGVFVSRPVLLTAGLIVVASAIYLISRLPERGPSHPDWPDDGAVL